MFNASDHTYNSGHWTDVPYMQKSKHAYLHSLNIKKGNQGCVVKSIDMNLPQTLRTGDHHFQHGSLADQRFLSWVQGLRGINWENAQAPD